MKQSAVKQAQHELEKCRAAVSAMGQVKRLAEAEATWTDFLVSAARIYNKLHAGTDGIGPSSGWFGRMKAERASDPLLSYIHHARASHEHTIDEVVEKKLATLEITFEPGTKMIRTEDEKGGIHIRMEQPSGEPAKAVLTPPMMRLLPVTDRRHGNVYYPPEVHLGQPVKPRNPPNVMALALAYLEHLVEEANKLAK